MARVAVEALESSSRPARAQGHSALQRERKRRRWSQAKLIIELRRVAAREGQKLPSNRSLTTMLSRWENCHADPDARYRFLLRQVYGKSDADLGFVMPAGLDEGAEHEVWLSLRDFCRELGVSYSTAYKWSHLGSESGRFPRCRRLPNGQLRIRRRDLDEWLDGLPTV